MRWPASPGVASTDRSRPRPGAARTVDIELVSIAVEDPDDVPDDGEEPTGPDDNADPEGNPSGIERVTILPPIEATGGCASTNAAAAPIALLGLLTLLSVKRRGGAGVPPANVG